MEKRRFTQQEVLNMAKEAYISGSAKFDFYPEHSSLLVIDMQDEFVRPSWSPFWVPEATRQVPKIKKLIEVCRKNSIPVIYTSFAKTHNYLDRPRLGPLMPNRYNSENIEGSEWFGDGKIYEELLPIPGDIVINKSSYGAFYDTPLETILKNLVKDTIIICGTLTNFCCGMTARQGYERGFKVIFGSDVNSTDDQEMHEVELKVLRKGFAKVLSSDEIISLIQKK